MYRPSEPRPASGGGAAVTGASYTWNVAGTTVQSGSSNSYTPVEADEGKALTIDVSFTDIAGNSETGSGNGGTVQDSADTVVALGTPIATAAGARNASGPSSARTYAAADE